MNFAENEASTCVEELAIAGIDLEAKMCQKISTKFPSGSIGYDENKLVTVVKSNIQCHGVFTGIADGRTVGTIVTENTQISLLQRSLTLK